MKAIKESKIQIILAAQRLIVQKGFNAITLQNILDEAKITKGKFFHYFSSKDVLYAEVLKYAFNNRERLRYDELLLKCPRISAYDKLIWLLDKTIEWYREGLPEIIRLCVFSTVFFSSESKEIKEARSIISQNTKIFESLIAAAQKDCDLPKALSAKICSLLFISVGVGGNTVGFLSDNKNLSAKNIEQLQIMLKTLNQLTKKNKIKLLKGGK